MARLLWLGIGSTLLLAASSALGQPPEPATAPDAGEDEAGAEATEPTEEPPVSSSNEGAEPTPPEEAVEPEAAEAAPTDAPAVDVPSAAPAAPTAAPPPAAPTPPPPTPAGAPGSSNVTITSTETELVEMPPPDALASDEEDGPRGWVYPVLGAALDVSPPIGDVGDEFTLSVGFALEGLVGLSPHAQIGGYLRLGFGGLDGDYYGDALQSADGADTHSVRVGFRTRLVAPTLGNAVTPFGDFSFGYSQLVLGVDGVIETCVENADGTLDCEREIVEDREYEAMAFGFGGGLAFETTEWGEHVAGVDAPASLKVFVRGTFFYEEWLGGPLDDATLDALDLHHVEIAAGVLYW